jgi:hypothetical protein
MAETLVFSSQGLTEALQAAVGTRNALTYTLTDISFIALDNSINTAGGNFVTAGFAVGQIINVTGSVSNNIIGGLVESVTTLKIIVAIVTLTDESDANSISLHTTTPATTWIAHLASVGPVTPGFTDTVSSYTESTETGYAPVTLAYTNYVWTVLNPNAIGTYANFSYTFTVAFATVTHVFITDNTGLILIGGSKLTTPNVSGTAGGTINIDSLAFAIS